MLTPQEISKYYKEQGESDNPLSPLEWQKQQTVSADELGADKIDLPEPEAPQKQEEFTQGLQAELEASRKQMEDTYQSQIDQLNKQLEESTKQQEAYLAKQKETMAEVEPLTTPFREQIEKSERERLKVEENYFANQSMVNELESLLTEINTGAQRDQELVKTGAISASTANKRREDSIARVGIIESTMQARNNQIGTALNFIDRTKGAIQADRQDRLNYLNTVFNFYQNLRDEEGNKISQLNQEQKSYIQAQIGLAEQDLAKLEATSQKIKDLMISPETAQMVYDAGIKLTDTVEEVNEKLNDWNYKQEIIDISNKLEEAGAKPLLSKEGVSEDLLYTYTDSKGKEHYFKLPEAEEEILSGGNGVTPGDPGVTPGGDEYNLGGVSVSDNVYSVLVGGTKLNDLTPAKQQEARAEMTTELGLHQEEIQNWFKPFMEQAFGVTFTDDEIADMWKELRVETGFVAKSSSSETENGEKAMTDEQKKAWEQEMGFGGGTAVENQSTSFWRRLGETFTAMSMD